MHEEWWPDEARLARMMIQRGARHEWIRMPAIHEFIQYWSGRPNEARNTAGWMHGLCTHLQEWEKRRAEREHAIVFGS
jgi:hypothetical protein